MARLSALAIGTCLVLAASIILAGCGGDKTVAASTTTVTRRVPQLPANVVRVHFKKRALAKAPRSGQVCITTYKTGHFCASYAAGEIPATALRRQAHANGWILLASN